MRVVVFSCQNNQELEDLSLVALMLEKEHAVRSVLYDISNVTGASFDPLLVERFSQHYCGVAVFNKKFSELSSARKLFLSMLNALNLLRVCIILRSSALVVGVPLLMYRLFGAMVFGRVYMFSYIRSLVVQSGSSTSTSSRLYGRLGSIKSGVLRRVISDYYADQVVCIGEMTAEFVRSRNVPDGNVKVLGSIYCDQRLPSISSEGEKSQEPREIVFLSSAFSAHGYLGSQIAQEAMFLEMLDYIGSSFRKEQVSFIVRKHPRESAEGYVKFCSLGGVVDDGYGDALNSYSPSALFISPVSTLLFELAYLGRSVALVSDKHFFSQHGEWYAKINANPIFDWRAVISQFVSGEKNQKVQGFDLGGIIDTRHKGRVLAEFAAMVAGRF